MAFVDWSIQGTAFGNCNCDWGCPCQFNAQPTHGDCRAIDALRVDSGHFGDTRLDGLCFINTYAWPRAIHEGDGSLQTIIDERADADQRRALIDISHGRETVEGGTQFQVFSATFTTLLDPLFAPIEFECDVERRTARVHVPGLIEARGDPIRNQVTGEEHRVRVTMPDGFEYTEAEFGSGSTTASCGIDLELKDSYGQFHTFHWTQNGIVR